MKMMEYVGNYQQGFRKAKKEMTKWEELQHRLVSQFITASSIIQRLQTIQDCNNYGVLRCVEGIQDAVLVKQMESLNSVLLSMKNTMVDFQGVLSEIEKIPTKGGSGQLKLEQKQQRLGVKPSVQDCLDGLKLISNMHRSEYQLRQTVVSKLAENALKRSACEDLVSLRRLLVDQPNISMEEVQNLLEIIFAGENMLK